MRSSVDLPEALGPISPMRSRSLMTNEIPSKSGVAPKRFDRPWALSMGGKKLQKSFAGVMSRITGCAVSPIELALCAPGEVCSKLIVYARMRQQETGLRYIVPSCMVAVLAGRLPLVREPAAEDERMR